MDTPRVGNAPFLLNTPGRILAGSPLAFSHRGFAPTGAENTLKAFAAATELGFGYLETDVQITSDGVLMVFHDEDLLRLTGDPRRIEECTAEELSALRVAGEPIPTFDQLLGAFKSAKFNVDVKSSGAAQALAAALLRHDAQQRVLVASFNGRRRSGVLTRLAAGAVPAQHVATSPGMLGVAAAALIGSIAPVPRAAYRGFTALQVPERQGRFRVVTPAFIAHAHDAGLQVHVWVINDAPSMHRLLDMGVDGIMSDRADILAEVMAQRGHWPQHQPAG